MPFNYSPRARYVNRYTELLAHVQRALTHASLPGIRVRETANALAHSSAMAARRADGQGSAVYQRHRIVPIVMGSAGWVSKALDRELRLLFQRGKRNPVGSKLANDLTIVAYDAALRMRSLWFAPV